MQGVQHIHDILEHTWKESLTGSLLTTNLEQLRIELGCNIDIFSSNFDDYESILVTESLLKET